MRLLFTTTEEIKSRVGFLYADTDFEMIKPDLEIATEEVVSLIGESVYDRAEKHFYGEPEEGSGSGSGDGVPGENEEYNSDPTSKDATVDDKLVHHIQYAVAYLSLIGYYENTDLSHESTGRKNKIENENEKLPWEWQIEKDNEAMLKKAYKFYDRLLSFLEKNVENITEWESSDARKLVRSLFILNTKQFNDILPIDNSHRFFYKIAPFMKEVEREKIKPAITADVFDDIKAELEAGSVTENADLYAYICNVIPFYAMAIAVKRLQVEVLPNGIVQNLISDRLTTRAKAVAPKDRINAVAIHFEEEGNKKMFALQEFIKKTESDEAGTDYDDTVTDFNDAEKPYFST